MSNKNGESSVGGEIFSCKNVNKVDGFTPSAKTRKIGSRGVRELRQYRIASVLIPIQSDQISIGKRLLAYQNGGSPDEIKTFDITSGVS
jgi:hypothetical protein